MNPISQFTLYDSNKRNNKHPSTHKKASVPNTCQSTPIGEPVSQIFLHQKYNSGQFNNICQNCQRYAKKLTEMRKKDVLSEYENEKLKDKISELKKDKQYLEQQLIKLTTNLFHKEDGQLDVCFNKQDLQAELFQAKFLIQLLQLSKHYKKGQLQQKPQLQNKDHMALSYKSNQSILQKNQKLLVQNFQLQEKIMMQDKIIHERNFYPLYHYDQRILMLRKSVIYWQNIAIKVCNKIQKQVKSIKQQYRQIIDDIANGKHIINSFQNTILQQVNKMQKLKFKRNEIQQKCVNNQNNTNSLSKSCYKENSMKQDKKKAKSKTYKKMG